MTESDGSVCGSRPEQCDFARAVLGSLEDEWRPLVEGDRLRAGGGAETNFDTPTLVVFGDYVASACGAFETSFGPFYCSLDRNFYLDFAWLDDLQTNASGDMGQAIVIAHEYAHWLQDKMGVGPYVRRFLEFRRPGAREMSVRYELQADCLAAVWGSLARDNLQIDEDDLREAAGVAHFTGNDAAQIRGGRDVDPSLFSHGSSEQRRRWMQRGFESDGDPAVCDTFAPAFAEL